MRVTNIRSLKVRNADFSVAYINFSMLNKVSKNNAFANCNAPNKLRIGLRDHASALFFQTDSTYNTEDVTYDKQVTLACHDLFVLYSNAFSEASNFNLVEFNQGTQEKQRSPS